MAQSTLDIQNTKNDNSLTIAKGILIILMVIGHSRGPNWLSSFLYNFHMPAFFIASGLYFKEKYLYEKWSFFQKKVESIYFPFIKWSLIFLVFHNFFFKIGLLNHDYGNENGVVSNWNHWNQFFDNFVEILTKMSGYDFFLLGGFWFLRSLFIGSLLFCISFWFVDNYIGKKTLSAVIVTLLFYGIAGTKAAFEWNINNWPQGGLRELMAIFFIGMGFLIGKKCKELLYSKKLFILSFFSLTAISIIHPASMKINISFLEWLILPIGGLMGFIMVYYLGRCIASYEGKFKTTMVYIGKRTLPILVFHFLMFKPASLLKIWLFDLDWNMVGCHPVIPQNNSWFWIVYSVVSLFLSLLLAKALERVRFLCFSY